ncbi:glycoside hydrolase family protein [Roseibium sp.]|uniref:glycoside hydrolase family protein n=1 Tax=Roseibium sp. TaxID=1936156 RepID=UPI003A9881C6
MKVSEKGLAFVAAHEGFVSKAYLDPAGVPTIGYGFTMGSHLFASWWRAHHLRPLALGDSITREAANKLLLKLLDEEYAPYVERALPDLSQHAFDACVSVVYNLGPRALSWRWARALKAGDLKRAASLLAKTGVTADGRRLAGLVRRRRDEADLLLDGNYGPLGRMSGLSVRAIKDLQSGLRKLGYRPGKIDGIFGVLTRKAVRAFQKDHPSLLPDGIAGPATRSTLERELSRLRGNKVSACSGLAASGTAHLAGLDWHKVILAGVLLTAVVLVLALLWRYRGRIRLAASLVLAAIQRNALSPLLKVLQAS